MYTIIFLTDAIIDIENAAEWYAERKEGLGDSFKEYTLAAIEKLRSGNITYKIVHRGLSRVIVKRFPYLIYFKKNPQQKQIIIAAVLHMRQSKSNLKNRI